MVRPRPPADWPPRPDITDAVDEQRALARVKSGLFGTSPGPPQVGRYRVVEQVGAGGAGVVYRAQDPELQRTVAIKVIRSARRGPRGDKVRQRLIQEARAIAAVNHPNVVEVFDVGLFEADGIPEVFIAMQYVDGPDVARWLAEDRRPWAEVVRVFLDAGAGLAAAHAEGLVHRDFKPSNVLLDPEGRAHVVDFGLARKWNDTMVSQVGPQIEVSPGRLTETGTVMGTPAYMAPEQRRGEGSALADQFSFCVSLYEGLCGRRPAWCNDPRRRPGLRSSAMAADEEVAIPRFARPVLERGLRLDPRERYPTMPDLLRDLRRRLLGRTRRRWVVAVGAAAVAGLGWATLAPGVQPCDDPGAALVWNDARRRQLVAALDDRGVEAAQDVGARMERYARAWVDAYAIACRLRSAQASDDGRRSLDHRMTCLASRRRRWSAAVHVLEAADDPRSALDVVAGLDPLSVCEEASGSLAPEPPDELAEMVEGQRRELARAEVFEMIGDYDTALRLGHQVLDEARASGYEPLVAEALVRLGNTRGSAAQANDAQALFSEAFSIATAHGDDTTALEAALGMFVSASSDREFERGETWRRNARALLDRGAGNVTHRARIAYIEGLMVAKQGDNARGVALVREAVELQRTVEDAEPIHLAQFELGLGALTLRDDPRAAVEAIERGVASIASIFGPDHAWLALPLAQLARAQRRTGDIEGGLVSATRSLQILDDKTPGDYRQRGGAIATLGQLHLDAGRHDQALARFDETLETVPALQGRLPLGRAIAIVGRARILAARGECDDISVDLDAAIEVMTNDHAFDPADIEVVREAVARCD